MIVQSEIKKWGNSLGLRVTGLLKEIPHFEEGTKVNIKVSETGLTITKLKNKSKKKLPFSENDLLLDLNEKNCHTNLLIEPNEDTEYSP